MPVALVIDELLYNVLVTEDLLEFAPILARYSIKKIDHLKDVTDEELGSYGLPPPAVRRLRTAFLEKDLQKAIQRRVKKKLDTKYVDISNVEEYKPVQNPHGISSPHHLRSNDVNSPSSSPTPLALILKDDIELTKQLGKGSFAIVKKAMWHKSEAEKVEVAVKILREINEEIRKDLIIEINIMCKLRHPNLIQFYGAVLDDPMLMVMEFCDGGAMLDRLRSSDKPVLLASQLHNYSVQIAAGMMYLEQKGYVHRDLATRNVLLTNNEQQVRICDFGLSRVVDDSDRHYILKRGNKVPFSWCPPESLRHRMFSSASDVWAFGVTLWELWTYGEEPWVGLRAIKVLEATESGERLRRPEKAPNNICGLMYSCWMLKPTDRPDFPKIHSTLSSIKFEILEAEGDHPSKTSGNISLKNGEKFVILEEVDSTTVRGQNMTTRKYGYASKNDLRTLQPIQQAQNPEVPKPIRPSHSRSPMFDNNPRVNQTLNFEPKASPVPVPRLKPNPPPPIPKVIFSEKNNPQVPQGTRFSPMTPSSMTSSPNPMTPTPKTPKTPSSASSNFPLLYHPPGKDRNQVNPAPEPSRRIKEISKLFNGNTNPSPKPVPPPPQRKPSPAQNRVLPEVPKSDKPTIKDTIVNIFVPGPKKQEIIGWNPETTGSSSGIYPSIQDFETPPTQIPMPKMNTKPNIVPPANNNHSNLGNNSLPTTEENRLFNLVRKEVPTADISDCRRALLKHNFNVTMAVNELKIQYLIYVMKVTDDPDCAASALDSCAWDLQRAADMLLS